MTILLYLLKTIYNKSTNINRVLSKISNCLIIVNKRNIFTDNEVLQFRDHADNLTKLQKHVFHQSEVLDASELNGRQLLDSSLKRMPPRYNNVKTYLPFTGRSLFLIRITFSLVVIKS